MSADGYCQACGIELIGDPEGAHGPGHVLCWSCWRERNAPPPEPGAERGPSLARRVAELERRLEEVAEIAEAAHDEATQLGWR